MRDRISKKDSTYKNFIELGEPIIKRIEKEVPELKGRLEFRLFKLRGSEFEAELIKKGYLFNYPQQILARLPIELFLINTPYSDSVVFRYIDRDKHVTVYDDEHKETLEKVIETYKDTWREIEKRGVRGKIVDTFSDRFAEHGFLPKGLNFIKSN